MRPGLHECNINEYAGVVPGIFFFNQATMPPDAGRCLHQQQAIGDRSAPALLPRILAGAIAERAVGQATAKAAV